MSQLSPRGAAIQRNGACDLFVDVVAVGHQYLTLSIEWRHKRASQESNQFASKSAELKEECKRARVGQAQSLARLTCNSSQHLLSVRYSSPALLRPPLPFSPFVGGSRARAATCYVTRTIGQRLASWFARGAADVSARTHTRGPRVFQLPLTVEDRPAP